ncbi:MAG: cytidylate kinase-like family protein [Fimbriimonas sp.]|nr:cytidylate kinase-like family protein [Fimbriimonas sp.]
MGILCVCRQIGAGETTIASAVANELGWQCIDRQILDRQVEETGVTLPEITHFDEHAPSMIESWTQSRDVERYFSALKSICESYAKSGEVVLVGRGAGFFLRDRDALHVRLIADLPFRLKRVMEIRWVTERRAREIIRESDRDRAAFHRRFFDVDWNDPIQYDMVLPTSRTGIDEAIKLLVAAVRSRWQLADRVWDAPTGHPIS